MLQIYDKIEKKVEAHILFCMQMESCVSDSKDAGDFCDFFWRSADRPTSFTFVSVVNTSAVAGTFFIF